MKFDAVIIGGGLAGIKVAGMLEQAGMSCAVISKGESLAHPDASSFKGAFFHPDRVLGADYKNGKIAAVHTLNFGKTPVEAFWFVLATGKFLAGGLAADMNGIRETVFGLDCRYDKDRSLWVAPDFYAPQPFMDYGVIIDDRCRCSRGGKIIENLFAAGEVVSGVEDIENSAIAAAKSILDARI